MFNFVNKVKHVQLVRLCQKRGRRSTFCREQQSRSSVHTSDKVEFYAFDFVEVDIYYANKKVSYHK